MEQGPSVASLFSMNPRAGEKGEGKGPRLVWYAPGHCLGSHICTCATGKWNGKVPDLHACQRTTSWNLSMMLGL